MLIAPRTCCLDLDTFFVSVERLLDPTLEGRPVVVGGHPGQRGVVTAASYEVRPFGVKSGMSMTEAERRAPAGTVFLPTRHGVYGPYAEQVRTVLERFCPSVQTASIDEFFLDFHGCEGLFAQPGDADADASIVRVVRAMCAAIRAEIGLPASAGIGTSRMVAKIASGLAKPKGVLLVPRGTERQIIGPLPVRKVPGIGPQTEARLLAVGVKTVNELLDAPLGPARAKFGRLAESIALTLDSPRRPAPRPDRPAFLEHDSPRTAGSISNERTFREDQRDPTIVAAQLQALVERVCWRARKRGVRATHVGLKLRYADFDTLTRSATVEPTDQERAVLGVVMALYQRARTRSTPIRLLGVVLADFVGPDPQLPIPFAAPSAAAVAQVPVRPDPGRAIDRVRERFGYDAIRLGDATAKSPKTTHVGHARSPHA